jgi:ADP-ribosylglycohydrolase
MSWPPPVGEPYSVADALGSFTELIEPGACTNARLLDQDRTFVVAEDEWSDDYTVRRIKQFEAISA